MEYTFERFLLEEGHKYKNRPDKLDIFRAMRCFTCKCKLEPPYDFNCKECDEKLKVIQQKKKQ